MSIRTRRPHTAHGTEAVAAALDDLELGDRLDLPDAPSWHDRFYVLSRLDDDRLLPGWRLVAPDAVTPDEAMDELAAAVGRDSPYEPVTDDAYDR